jgi:hypothetical protein
MKGEPKGELVAIEDARKRAEEKAAAAAPSSPAADEPPSAGAAIVATIAKELAGLAGPDGVVRLGGQDAASRERTAAVLKGIGQGIGNAIADAFSKWAEKVLTPPPPGAPTEPANPSDTLPDPPPAPNGPKGQA